MALFVQYLQFFVNSLCNGAVIACIGLGFSLIYTTTGVFHIAHASACVVGGYAFYVCADTLGVPVGVAGLVSVCACALFGVGVDKLVYQPLASRPNASAPLLISSLGVQIASVYVVASIFGQQSRSVELAIGEPIFVGKIIVSRVQAAQVIVAVAVSIAYVTFLRLTALGRLCRAMADDPQLASVFGVPVRRLRAIAFALGSALAGTGGVLSTVDVGIDPHGGFDLAMGGIVACILGGRGNFAAPALGALLVALLQSLITWRFEVKWSDPAIFGLLLCFLFVRPTGILQVRRRGDETQ